MGVYDRLMDSEAPYTVFVGPRGHQTRKAYRSIDGVRRALGAVGANQVDVDEGVVKVIDATGENVTPAFVGARAEAFEREEASFRSGGSARSKGGGGSYCSVCRGPHVYKHGRA